jgi:uncharacterized delta-60 repeat protein
VARQRTAKKDLRGTGQAGSRGGDLFELLEGRRLMSVASLTGAPTVNEGSPYTVNFSASGFGAGAGTSDWTITWANGPAQVLSGSATSDTHTFDDGTSSQSVSAYRTNQVTSGLSGGDGFISINDVAVDSLGRIVTVGAAGSWLEVRRFNPDGTPDTSFSGDGVYNVQLSGTTSARLTDVAVDTSDRIVAAGDVTTVPFDRQEGFVARFTDAGLDVTFNSTGSGGGQAGTARVNFGKGVSENAVASAVVVQPDGRILVGGTILDTFSTRLDFGVARLDGSGAPDSTFSGGSVRTDFTGGGDDLHDLAITTSGGAVTGIYAVGDLNNIQFAVAAYNADGSAKIAFGGTGKVLTNLTPGADIASNVALDGTGRIVVSGYANAAIGLVRYNANGSLDSSFGVGGIQTSNAATGWLSPDQALENLVIDGTGNILVGARLGNSANRGFGVARYTSGGDVDGTFGSHGLIFRNAPEVLGGAIAMQSDGGIVQAGTVPDVASNLSERNAVVLHYANASAGVSVQNVAPTVSLISPTTGAPHQFHPIDVHLADVSAADTAAGVGVSFDFGDGSAPLTASGFPVTDFPFEWLYNEAGTYTVTLTVTDKDGGTSVATTTFTIASTAVVTDDVNGGQMLVIAGGRTSGPGGTNSNSIDVRPKSGGVQVSVDGAVTNFLAPIQRIVVYGDGGNDVITVSGSLPVPVEFYGGDGNDSLRSGGKDDILSGGAGDDLLVGGNGRDFLIGGIGADRLVGDSDEDILVGGSVSGEESWNELGVDRSFLSFVRTAWTDPTTSYAARVANLRESALIADVTVFDDDTSDTLTGSSGNDWFFANVDGDHRDVITDLTAKEFADDLDFIAAV